MKFKLTEEFETILNAGTLPDAIPAEEIVVPTTPTVDTSLITLISDAVNGVSNVINQLNNIGANIGTEPNAVAIIDKITEISNKQTESLDALRDVMSMISVPNVGEVEAPAVIEEPIATPTIIEPAPVVNTPAIDMEDVMVDDFDVDDSFGDTEEEIEEPEVAEDGKDMEEIISAAIMDAFKELDLLD